MFRLPRGLRALAVPGVESERLKYSPRSRKGTQGNPRFLYLTRSMKKKILIGMLSLVVLLFALSLATGITLVIPISEYKAPEHPGLKKGQIVNPLQRMDFKSGNWVACLVIVPSDYRNLHPAFKKVTCFKSDDLELFERMKKKWNFVYTAGDVATVQSAIFFLKDGKIEFESGIVIDKNWEGLQDGEYGWLEPVEEHALSDHLKHFKRFYWPVLIF